MPALACLRRRQATQFPPPPTNVPKLSSALMQGFHEECLRLSIKVLKGQTTSQDLSDASLWFNMLGQHFVETDFDSVIRTVAAKSLNQTENTGIPVDRSVLEQQLSSELSARVGWDVSAQIHSMFNSNFDNDVDQLKNLSKSGLSEATLEVSKALALTSSTMQAEFTTGKKHPRLIEASFSGYQSHGVGSSTYPPPAPRPPIVSYCQTVENWAQGTIISASAAYLLFNCQAPTPVTADGCASIAFATTGAGLVDLLAKAFC